MPAQLQAIPYKSFGERSDDERQFLHEFDIVSWKMATQMSHLTEEEIKLWNEWISLHSWGSTYIENFFGPAEKDEPFFEAIQVRVWKWTHLVHDEEKVDHLIDMNAWPDYREDELGAIALNGQLVFENIHDELYIIVQAPLELILRTGSLNHLRQYHCENDDSYDEEPEAHQHCKNISTRLKELGSS